jgi:hypothetical protein
MSMYITESAGIAGAVVVWKYELTGEHGKPETKPMDDREARILADKMNDEFMEKVRKAK